MVCGDSGRCGRDALRGFAVTYLGNPYPDSRGRWYQVWGVYLVHGYCDTRWLTGLWSFQAMVEGIVPKAARHWGSNNSVVNDPPLVIQAAPHCM